ncbi:YALI0C15719p [Yarrowia lipolytica CLIB122]|uniref:YALI0C15719p n=1 Tax=Yarrowia lipolytica (strain CLIB 122 / E 150) TaxID=284591 RepID=Q6CBT4_YARLI|nr:YALI0C15719p [Yarrowia lipolytica CLIB122]CAG82191.1 YALI0C15719p [Yarrowia lipolytica CLIB122]|eukprot:XP_501878.1 YALI0C15719p [Yarrowia lipolytica CLIB122]
MKINFRLPFVLVAPLWGSDASSLALVLSALNGSGLFQLWLSLARNT